MNDNEIRNMEAGREMDALVAEKVMGWEWYTLIRRDGSMRAMMYAPGKETDALVGKFGLVRGIDDGCDFIDTTSHPRYSTDIAAAWQVIEKMIGGEYEISMANREDREGYSFWGVDFYTMIDEAALDACFSADAPTTPLAICRAALLAVMGDES